MVWRGGRRFSQEQAAPKTDKPKGKANGGDDSIMIIESDEESAPEPAEEEPSCQFETEEPEVDPAHPFEDVLRQIDVPLGSRVLDLAVPRVLPETARSPLEPFPPILSKKIVVSAVCADLSTRVVTLPLAPPHPATDPTQIQTLLISGGISHQEIPRGVSITFTCQEAEAPGLGRSRRASTSKGPDSRGKERWDLLVATHSAEASGLLLLHQIPIVEESDGLYYVSESDLESRRRSLPSPAKSIAFNPSSYPSARHSTLLVAFHSGCIKIYSCFSQSRSSRKPSAEETEIDGKWLISLYPGFEQQSGSGMGRRKTVVDAEWVLGGRAVMILLADGEWGVWDIEGAGPGSMKGPLERQSSIQGVSGGSLTAYSVSGKILRPFADGKSETGAGEQRRFAPMTPSTKRVREDNLLKGSGGTPSTSLCGQISVIQTNSSRDALPDESVLVRHGKQLAVIPSLLSLWRNATKATGTFDSSSRCRVSTIADINLMGENFTGIGALPAAARHTRQTERTEFDILVTGEHRIVILAPELSEPAKADFQPANETASAETDQLMLQKGELDVNGMGRVLNGMARSQRMSPTKRVRTFT